MADRRRKEISLRFRLRPSQRHDVKPRPLLIRLTMDGQTVTDYMSGITVRPPKWEQANQMMSGRTKLSEETNERLAEIELQHREILRELKRRYAKGEGLRPTAELVKSEFLKPGSSSPRLHQWFGTYLNYLDSLDGLQDGRAEKTMARGYKTWEYVNQFDPTSPYLADLTTGWAKRFHVWLQTHPATGKSRMQKDSANKYLSHVRDALDYAVDEGYLSHNALDKFRPKRGKGKPVYFMEPEHIERLMSLRFSGQLGYVLWWTKLMCFTGLDYVDVVRYARNRQAFHQQNSTGLKIVIERSKPPCNTCEIPLLGEIINRVEALFQEYPQGPPAPVLADINRHLKVIQPLVGFDKTFTSKILRKTAGAYFLREGYAISTVSRALGHSSIRTTETHYVKVTASATDYDMERVARMQGAGTIKLRSVVNHSFNQSLKTC